MEIFLEEYRNTSNSHDVLGAEVSAGKTLAAQCEDWNSDLSTNIKPRACGIPFAIQESRQTG